MPTTALDDFMADLGAACAGALRTDEYSRILYSTDASIYQVKPHGVLLPRSPEQVHAAVELAHRYGISLMPRTGGSSLAGQAVGEALVIDFTAHLNEVLEFIPEQRSVRVQPGMVLDRLNLLMAPHGLQFGPDPASSNRAAMGGIVANNSTGSHSIVYGMTADHVLEMNAVLSDGTRAHLGPLDEGELACRTQARGLVGAVHRGIRDLVADASNRDIILRGTPRHWRRCGGYNLDRFAGPGPSFRWPQDPRFNLSKLVCGSEGSLAVIEDVTLNLVPCPKVTGLGVVRFGSLDEALCAVPLILEVGPSAVELLDNLALTLCRGVPQYARLLARFMEGEPECVLVTEFSGDTALEVADGVDRLQAHLKRHRTGHVTRVLDKARQHDVWTVRKVGLGLLMSIKGDYKPIPFIEDAAVPPEHLASYVRDIDQFCSDRGTRVAYYGHASAGCVHIRPLINTKAAGELAKLPAITAFAAELLRGCGGVLSSEHGDGRVRSWMNERFFGPELYGLYQKVKDLFDPENLLCPGNVVSGPPQAEQLRFGADYEVMALPLKLDWEADRGFNRAVEMCNGAGICRKETAGTMCPSFMATREEEHSTRGRANALRAALSGRLPPEELTSRRMYEVMDLCIECKACKAECPSSVDMAKIKFEFLAQYHERHRVPWRSRVFAHAAVLGWAASGLQAHLINPLLRSDVVRRGLDRALGISAQRTLPPFAPQPFTRWFARHARHRAHGQGTRPQVVLFHDTFTTYHEPHVAISATRVLEAAGFEVLLSNHGCCGRPMISKGLVREARRAARRTVDTLVPWAAAGLPIVGLEPSCLLSLVDEYLYLLPGDAAARQVADAAVLFEEFVTQQVEAGMWPLQFVDQAQRVLLHGHCHQKALVGSGASKRVLSLPPGYEVHEVDSGCCGMAGSFGYEKEHYDVSLRMAERRLMPAVRAEGEATLIVAAGVSCRAQIRHATGRQALHPAEVLCRAAALD